MSVHAKDCHWQSVPSTQLVTTSSQNNLTFEIFTTKRLPNTKGLKGFSKTCPQIQRIRLNLRNFQKELFWKRVSLRLSLIYSYDFRRQIWFRTEKQIMEANFSAFNLEPLYRKTTWYIYLSIWFNNIN